MRRSSLFSGEAQRPASRLRWPRPSFFTLLLLLAWASLVVVWQQLYVGVRIGARVGEEAAPEAVRLLPPGGLAMPPAARAPTLVVYVFSGSDAEYAKNLRFFVREAVKAGDGCDYIIVLQEGEGLEAPAPLPALPPNARYVRHENRCFDIGTVGWVLGDLLAGPAPKAYAYYIWLNSSVRGPFLPAYLRGAMHWTEPLLSKLGPRVKLVGATVNCGRAYELPPTAHIQSYVAATDAAGLGVLLAAGTVFRCWDAMRDTVVHSEIGATTAILEAGYTIDCLMLRYQGLDWRDPALRDAHCNGGLNPLQPGFNDGISVDPLEVMFVKVKASMRAAGNWPHVAAAVKLDQWLAAQAAAAAADAAQTAGDAEGSDVGARPGRALLLASAAANEWPSAAAPALLADAQRRGVACFDADFYIRSSAYDLGFLLHERDGAAQAWDQFLRMGLYEGRPYRFTC